ncbi:MAG: hypothetical protein ACYCZD_09370 [Rhodanobacter sp.]
MSRASSHRAYRWIADFVLPALGMALIPMASMAADAHKAVQAKPGEIVVLRNVAARPAVRQEPPGMALIADPSPQRELAQALGTGELSDADYASLNAASRGSNSPHGTAVERMAGNAFAGGAGSNGSASGGVAGNGISNVIAAPIGAVGNTTRGIGDQVQGALSQLPGLIPVPATGH